MSQQIRHAVILAAGRGQRMMPLTENCPKPLLSIAGHALLEYIICGLRDAGISEVVIVLGYLGHMIETYFGRGERYGIKLTYCRQQTQNGTAGALLAAEGLCGDTPFVLHWGDILISPENYPHLLTAYAAVTPPPAALLGANWTEDRSIHFCGIASAPWMMPHSAPAVAAVQSVSSPQFTAIIST